MQQCKNLKIQQKEKKMGSNLDITSLIANYIQNSIGALIFLGLILFASLYFLRNPIKNYISSTWGHRSDINDAAICFHENRDIIYENEKVLYEINIFGFGVTLLSILSLLVSPFVFILIYAGGKIINIKNKASNLKDFIIFKDLKDSDSFLDLLNNHSAKIDYYLKEIQNASYVFILAGFVAHSYTLAIIGALLAVICISVSLFALYNVLNYKLNYKYTNYYRALELLTTSQLGNLRGIYVYSILSIASVYLLTGFSVWIWLIVLLKVVQSAIILKALENETFENKRHEQIDARDYSNITEAASYPNFKSQSKGYKWTTPLQAQLFSFEKEAKSDKLITLNKYFFAPEMVNKSALSKNPMILEKLQNIDIKVSALDWTKQILIIGEMGTGKTEQINYYIEQIHNSNFTISKAITHNDRKGNYTERWYREDKDHILNFFDKRSSVFCIFTEMAYNIEAGTNFIENMFTAIQGDETDDFFAPKAKQLMSQWVKEAYFESEKNHEKAWELLFIKIQEYKDNVKDDKTKSSIYQVIELGLETFEILKYQILIEKRKIFSIHKYLRTENTQLFIMNNPEYENKLAPYLSGIWGAYVVSVTSKGETKEHLILNNIDEFLSLKLEETTRKTLLTLTRGFGYQNLIAVQYLPEEDKNFLQNIDSSKYALMVFSASDDFTKERVTKKIDKAEALVASSSPDTSKQGGSGSSEYTAGIEVFSSLLGGATNKKYQTSYSLQEFDLVNAQQVQSMPPFTHITFIPKEQVRYFPKAERIKLFALALFGLEEELKELVKTNDYQMKESGVLYLGYTPLSKLNYNNRGFEKWDMTEYFASQSIKNKVVESKIEASELIKNIDEKTLFKHYMSIRFAGTIEESAKYAMICGLSDEVIEQIFIKMDENSVVLEKLIDKYTEQERYDLMNDFFDIDENDWEAKFAFIKKYDLIGGMLGVFAFSDEFLIKIANEYEEA